MVHSVNMTVHFTCVTSTTDQCRGDNGDSLISMDNKPMIFSVLLARFGDLL